MSQIGMYALMSAKRLLHRPVYLILLCLMPLTILALSGAQKEQTVGITAMLYAQVQEPAESESMAKQIINQLLEADGAVRFLTAESEEEIKQAVLKKEVDCGYVFSKTFDQGLAEDNWKRSVTLYCGEEELIPALVNELVYTAVFREYSADMFVDYMGTAYENIEEGREYAENKANDLLNVYLINGSTFSFSYYGSLPDAQEAYEEEVEEASKLTTDVVPVRGMLALFMMLCAFCGLIDYKRDREAGRLVWVKNKVAAQMVRIMLPVLGAATVSLLCLWASGDGNGWLVEITNVIIYMLLLIAYTVIWGILFQSEHGVVASIPFLLIATILFCPVFWNLKAVLPVFQIMEKIFPVSWYLAIS